MEKEKQNKQYEPSNYSFTTVPDYFFRKLINVMGGIPSLVYLSLLSYCHKKKYIAWPSLNTMSQEMGMAKTTIIRNLNILIELNFIKNIAKDNSSKNYYHHNVYQITPPEKIFLSHFSDAKNNAVGGSRTLPLEFQNATSDGSETIPLVVAERYPNNNNLNNNNITTTKEEKDAVVAVDFKKLKEKGEEKMQAIRERMVELDFKEEFVEKILKEYSMKKIDEKIDLLMERRNIQRPDGWLMAALKNDYRGEEQERYDEEPVRRESQLLRIDSRFRGNDIKGSGNDIIPNVIVNDHKECGNLESTPKQVSREKAIKAIKLIQDNLSACISPIPSCRRSRFRKNVGVRSIEPAKLRGG
jgi:predicted transcriptional regulator